jgi:xylulose-5-phosphate/fructose-6-phosphate phosphoketolase
MRSYRPGELFGENGVPDADLAGLVPKGYRRMSANPHANGGLPLRELSLPDFRGYAVTVEAPGAARGEATRVLGGFLPDVMAANPGIFRLFGPDETASNRLQAVFEVTNRGFMGEIRPGDDHLADGSTTSAGCCVIDYSVRVS